MNTEFKIQIDGLKNAKYNPAAVYANNAKLMVNKDYLKMLGYTDDINIINKIQANNVIKIISVFESNYLVGQDIQKTFRL